MAALRFTKMHGLDNDYVFVNVFDQHIEDPSVLARAVSNRHRGVGSDGLILVAPPTSSPAHVRMIVFNADGSRGRMCGNGIRCVAKYAYERKLCRSNPMHIETDSGIKTLDLTINDDRVTQVRVDMGEPELNPSLIPVRLPHAHSGPIIEYPISKYIPMGPPAVWMKDCGWHDAMTCVSMGNPHAIVFVDHIASVPLEKLGLYFERQPIFPERINVHFVQIHHRTEGTMISWERGSGVTQACGTGACATLVAGVLTNRLDRKATIHLTGGDLLVDWADNNHVFMTGPAEEVFSGEWLIGAGIR